MAGLGCGIAGVPLYTFGYFIEPLMERHDMSRPQVAGWATAFTMTILVAAPLVGRLTDAVGARRVAGLSFAGLALSYVYAAFATGGAGALLLSAVLVAALGSGTLPVGFTKVVATHFTVGRGLALGIGLCGVVLGVTVASYLVPWAMQRGGLRSAYLALAALALAVLPIVAVGLREARSIAAAQTSMTPGGLCFREAVAQPVFWLLAASFFAFCLAATGVVVNFVPAMGERGIAPRDTSIYFAALSAGSIVGRVAIGFLADRVFAPRLLCLVFAVTAGAALLLVLGDTALIPLAIAVLGFAIGAEVDLIAYLAAAYFGMRQYGQIYGALYTVFALGSAVGPPLVAWLRETSGDYVSAFSVCSLSMALSALLFIAVARFPFLRVN